MDKQNLFKEVLLVFIGKIGYDDHSRPISIDLPNSLALWVLH
jgi:hypothetical protein